MKKKLFIVFVLLCLCACSTYHVTESGKPLPPTLSKAYKILSYSAAIYYTYANAIVDAKKSGQISEEKFQTLRDLALHHRELHDQATIAVGNWYISYERGEKPEEGLSKMLENLAEVLSKVNSTTQNLKAN